MPKRRRRDQRAKAQRRGYGGERVEGSPGVERGTLRMRAIEVQVVVGAEHRRKPVLLASARQRHPLIPADPLLTFDHETELHRAWIVFVRSGSGVFDTTAENFSPDR